MEVKNLSKSFSNSEEVVREIVKYFKLILKNDKSTGQKKVLLIPKLMTYNITKPLY
jgi:hypothetical protein